MFLGKGKSPKLITGFRPKVANKESKLFPTKID
jgi:hypothetical protein